MLLSVLVSVNGFSQTRTFYGRVLDHRMNGIPFAVIEAKDRHEGVYTNEWGVFAFTANSDTVKTLVFSCMGYETKEIPVADFPNDSLIIALKQKVAQLKEYQITADKGEGKERILGRKKPKKVGDCYRYYGSETAIFLQPGKGKDGFLKDLYVFITNEGAYNTKFRMHVYEYDSLTQMPGEELTDSNLIMQASHGNEWVKADVSIKGIHIDKGVFISIEWISGMGNTQESLKSNRHNEVTNYNGQVLGLTMDYGYKSLTYSRKPFQKEWAYYDPTEVTKARLAAGAPPPPPTRNFLNPMIYATYYPAK